MTTTKPALLVHPSLGFFETRLAGDYEVVKWPTDRKDIRAAVTIGGMAANNSCGSKSIRYGLMADNVRAIDAILADVATRCGWYDQSAFSKQFTKVVGVTPGEFRRGKA